MRENAGMQSAMILRSTTRKRRKIFTQNAILHPLQQDALQQIVEGSAATSYIGMLSGISPKSQVVNVPSSLMRSKMALNISSIEEQQEQEEKEEKEELLEDTLMVSCQETNQSRFSASCMHCLATGSYESAECKLVHGHALEIAFIATGRLLCFNFDTVNVRVYKSYLAEQAQMILTVGPFELAFTHILQLVVDKWYHTLRNIQLQSLGAKFDLKLESKMVSKRYETERYFINNCQTGDVILFQDSHFFARAQRFFTRSEYDHVGLIIRDPVYDILIFESNSTSGVSLTLWSHVIKYEWYSSIPKITWRRLSLASRDKILLPLHEFVMRSLKKNYHISFHKLITNQSYVQTSAKPSEQTQNIQDGYFCSELVATAYKELRLLTRNKEAPHYQPACNFIPYDFTEKAALLLEEGSLSPQYQIIFDTNVLKEDYPQ